MTDDLVTAAVFGDQTVADVVRLQLEEAGIPAFLMDQLTFQSLFVVGAAIGGIRLQVASSRLEEALRLINEQNPDHAAPVNWSEVDVGKPEAVEAEELEGDFPPEHPAVKTAPADEEVVVAEPSDLTVREQRADRIVRGALIGLIVLPVFLLALWRVIQIANSTEQLRPEYQRKANIGATIVGVEFLLLLFGCCLAPALRLG